MKKCILQSCNTLNDYQLLFRLLDGTDVYVLLTVIILVNAKK